MVLLGEERMASEVDKPIDEAAQAFQWKIKMPISYSDFKRVIAEFVRHLYRYGLRLPRQLSDQEAFTEAVSLLRWNYEGVYTKGYDGAVIDATSGDIQEIEMVLYGLGETVKMLERQKYVQWVFLSNIDPLDWNNRCQLASTYQAKYKNFLPPKLQTIDPAWLVDDLRQLILNHMSVENLMV
jgi:hypothetical protein